VCYRHLADGQLLPIEIEGTKILLFREGATFHAIGATCPHAGAPLAEGVRDGHRIICPWHKATFCLRTGVLLEPPAVDDLPRYAVKCEIGRIQITLPAEEPTQSSPVADQRLFAIIGAGAAGALAAQTLRQQGFGGRIVMLDPENRVPYDRTLLSKYHLSGQPVRRNLRCRPSPSTSSTPSSAAPRRWKPWTRLPKPSIAPTVPL
jgi:apoptosis-inducing factor 3